MNSTTNSYGMRFVQLALVLLLVPTLGWAQTGQPKSKEEILDGLLGGERAPGGKRQEQSGAPAAQGRVALPINFEYNSVQISPESAEQLRNVAQALNDPQMKAARIRIEGHTDSQGSHAYNLRLSQARAAAVVSYLVDKEGIAAARLQPAGYGFDRPLPGASQDTEEGRAANRRVEFVNLGTGTAPPVAARPPAVKGMSVDVLVNYKSGDQVRKVSPGTVLGARDNYRVSFTPARDGYVYVYEVDAAGKASSVYPNAKYSAGSNPVKAKRAYTVPEGENWLRMEDRAGNREIVVLGAERELSNPEAVVLGLVSDERAPAGTRPGLAAGAPEDMFTYRLPFKGE